MIINPKNIKIEEMKYISRDCEKNVQMVKELKDKHKESENHVELI